MGTVVRKVLEVGWKTSKKVKEIDVGNPLFSDTVNFVVDVAKEIIKPF